MGGLHAPSAIIEAIAAISTYIPDVDFIICGDEGVLLPLLDKSNLSSDRFELCSTATVILDDDKPTQALRNGRNSSMRKAIDAVKEGKAHACLSGGNTGALMVTAKVVLGGLEGIKRPAIAGIFPTIHGSAVMLDMGANNECNEFALFQFALMGMCFAKIVLHKERPSIAILNVGEEEIKGRDLERQTYALLKSTGLNFIGYIEGHDIVKGKADVVVTDGFSGNLVLKSYEGAANIFLHLIKEACTKGGVFSKLGGWMLKPSLKKHLGRVEPNVNNGAMFMGVNGIVVKSHGSATKEGLITAINATYELAKKDVNSHIIRELKELEKDGIGLNIVDKIKQTSAKILGITR